MVPKVHLKKWTPKIGATWWPPSWIPKWPPKLSIFNHISRSIAARTKILVSLPMFSISGNIMEVSEFRTAAILNFKMAAAFYTMPHICHSIAWLENGNFSLNSAMFVKVFFSLDSRPWDGSKTTIFRRMWYSSRWAFREIQDGRHGSGRCRKSPITS